MFCADGVERMFVFLDMKVERGDTMSRRKSNAFQIGTTVALCTSCLAVLL
jgi:hypothetical protein